MSVSLQAKIVDNVIEVKKWDKKLRFSLLKLEDGTGITELKVWNDIIDTLNIGDSIEIQDGFVTSFNNQLKVTLGRKGKLRRLEI